MLMLGVVGCSGGGVDEDSNESGGQSSADLAPELDVGRAGSDDDAGAPAFARLRKEGEQHPIEATGRELRKLMSWVKSDDDYTEGTAAR